MSLQFQKKESPGKLEIFILCPGLNKDEIEISFDKKEGILDIIGKSGNKSLSEVIDTSIAGTVEIPPKYRANKVEAAIQDGIAILVFGLAKDVELIKVS